MYVMHHEQYELLFACTYSNWPRYLPFLSKPSLEISDLETISNLAHSHGLPVIVDSTFSTPYLTKPFEFGCDIIASSLTKWAGGHGAG